MPTIRRRWLVLEGLVSYGKARPTPGHRAAQALVLMWKIAMKCSTVRAKVTRAVLTLDDVPPGTRSRRCGTARRAPGVASS